MQRHISSRISALTFGILVLSFLVAFYVVAWQEPTQAPPAGNVAAPLNSGVTGQSKSGGLILNTGGAVNGLVIDKGNLCLGTDCRSAWPSGGGTLVNYQMSARSYTQGSGYYSQSTSYSCPSGATVTLVNCTSIIQNGVQTCSCPGGANVATLTQYVVRANSNGTAYAVNSCTPGCDNWNSWYGYCDSSHSCVNPSPGCTMVFQCASQSTVGVTSNMAECTFSPPASLNGAACNSSADNDFCSSQCTSAGGGWAHGQSVGCSANSTLPVTGAMASCGVSYQVGYRCNISPSCSPSMHLVTCKCWN